MSPSDNSRALPGSPQPRTRLFTRIEENVVLDALQRLTACTPEELADTMEWSGEEIDAWQSAMHKLEQRR